MALHPTVVELCVRFNDRSQELGLKGKKRDDEAMAYFIGASQMADIFDEKELAQRIYGFAAFCLAFRGFKEVEQAIREADR